MAKSKELGFFYRKSTQKALWFILFLVCGVSVVSEFSLHRHSHFSDSGFYSIDASFAFFAFLGFLASLLILILSKLLTFFVSAKEDYYES